MGDIQKIEPMDKLLPVLKSSIFPGAKNESISMALAYCKAASLDILQKPVHIVPMYDKETNGMRDVIMPGIGLYRTQAARSGEYAGQDEPEFGDTITKKLGDTEVTFPEWCKVTVRRLVNGNVVSFTAKEYWLENYAQKGGRERSIAPNAMWLKRPFGQLSKCTEAQALRKAFPEAVGSAPTAEEMEGKELLANVIDDTIDKASEFRSNLSDASDSNSLKTAFAAAYKWAKEIKSKTLMDEFKSSYDALKANLAEAKDENHQLPTA